MRHLGESSFRSVEEGTKKVFLADAARSLHTNSSGSRHVDLVYFTCNRLGDQPPLRGNTTANLRKGFCESGKTYIIANTKVLPEFKISVDYQMEY